MRLHICKKWMLFLVIGFQTGLITAQPLKSFSLTLRADSNQYLSFKNRVAYTESGAEAEKDVIDLALMLTSADSGNTLEWYNLKKDNEKVPERLTGTRTGIVAMSFDREQFDKCRTTADLDRMTGHISVNSYSHFAVIGHDSQVQYPCFLARTEAGKKALLFISSLNGNRYTVYVKLQE